MINFFINRESELAIRVSGKNRNREFPSGEVFDFTAFLINISPKKDFIWQYLFSYKIQALLKRIHSFASCIYAL
jgi:hypothetical protein